MEEAEVGVRLAKIGNLARTEGEVGGVLAVVEDERREGFFEGAQDAGGEEAVFWGMLVGKTGRGEARQVIPMRQLML